VCLVTGSIDSVRQVYLFIMDKVREKPDTKPTDGEVKVSPLVCTLVSLLMPCC